MLLASWLSSAYESALPSPGQRAAFWLLTGMLLSFLFIRTSARLMRSPKVPWWPGSVTTGDLHVHHLVFGICIVLATGFLGFAVQPSPPWLEILAALFGIGAGLTLDEFALWLHLSDVYWKDEGRKSFEAVVVAAVLGGLVLVGLVPFEPGEDNTGFWAFALVIAINVALCIANVLKGKYFMAVIALFLPLVGWIGVFRLAAPTSPWARWFYRKPKKLERARRRRERVDARRRRWTDRIAGAPEAPAGAPGGREVAAGEDASARLPAGAQAPPGAEAGSEARPAAEAGSKARPGAETGVETPPPSADPAATSREPGQE